MPDSTGITPFDWSRMLTGDHPWLFLAEVVVRTTIIYVYALVVIRLMGKRTQSGLSSFEYIIVIALGSAAGDPMLYPEVGIIPSLVVFTVILVLERTLAGIVSRSDPIEHFVEGKPRLLVSEGRLLPDELGSESLARDELFMLLREKGVRQLGEVEFAYLETSGGISVFPFPAHRAKSGLPIVPPLDVVDPVRQLHAGAPSEGGEMACTICGGVINTEPDGRLPPCPWCGGGRWAKAEAADR